MEGKELCALSAVASPVRDALSRLGFPIVWIALKPPAMAQHRPTRWDLAGVQLCEKPVSDLKAKNQAHDWLLFPPITRLLSEYHHFVTTPCTW